MKRYSYNGPILEFNRIIANNWYGETVASTEARARTNLAHQFKMETGRAPISKITLPGKIKVEGEG